VWLNPVYHVGMLVAEWQAARYKAAQEELRTLQLRKLNLEKKLEGKSDAKIEQQISYMQKRVDDLEYKIVKMEKKG
jgi:ABC-type phosphate transport system auxiliary subunit